MIIDIDSLSSDRVYHTLTQTLIPRPIAWVLSDNGKIDNFNLAPFSYFTAVSSDPALLMISIGEKSEGVLKDTRLNLLQRKKCVVHIASSAQAENVTQSAATLPHGQSEVELLGLSTVEFEGFSLPRLECCDIAYACELYEYKEIAQQGLIFLLIKQVYLSDNVARHTEKGRLLVDAEKVNPLARLGGSQYWVEGRSVSVQRPR